MENVKISDAINTYEIEERTPPIIESGMLSSPHIKYCILKYNIITCEGESQDTLLKQVNSAVFEMRLGYKAWGVGEKGEKFEYDLNYKDAISLAPNSLTFLTTKEELNLPEDIIARFNLKSKWVHKGLLLGTGPIVDPEFKGRLFIPVHNFSNEHVLVPVNKNLINVEFTKTLNPKHQFLEQDIKCDYNYNTSFDFKIDEYVEKIGKGLPSSSIFSQEQVLNDKLEDYKSKTRIWSWIGIGTFLVGGVSLILAAFAMYSSFSGIVAQAQKDISNFNALLRVEEHSENTINTKQFVLRHEYDELNEKYNRLIKELEFLKHAHKKNDPEAQKSH